MVFQRGRDDGPVPGGDGRDQLPVPVDDLGQVTTLELDRGTHQRAHLAVERVPQLGEPAAAARLDEHAVQPGVTLDHRGQVAAKVNRPRHRRRGLGAVMASSRLSMMAWSSHTAPASSR